LSSPMVPPHRMPPEATFRWQKLRGLRRSKQRSAGFERISAAIHTCAVLRDDVAGPSVRPPQIFRRGRAAPRRGRRHVPAVTDRGRDAHEARGPPEPGTAKASADCDRRTGRSACEHGSGRATSSRGLRPGESSTAAGTFARSANTWAIRRRLLLLRRQPPMIAGNPEISCGRSSRGANSVEFIEIERRALVEHGVGPVAWSMVECWKRARMLTSATSRMGSTGFTPALPEHGQHGRHQPSACLVPRCGKKRVKRISG
jgi:hypothetical protein